MRQRSKHACGYLLSINTAISAPLVYTEILTCGRAIRTSFFPTRIISSIAKIHRLRSWNEARMTEKLLMASVS